MKTLSRIVSAAALLVLPAGALAAPSSLDMTCRDTAALVRGRGAVILSTGSGLFGRYVSGERYCENGLILVPAWIPTKDSAQCFVGYTCEFGVPQGGR